MTGVYAFFYAMGAMDVGKLPLLLIVAKKAGVARCYGDWGPEFLPERFIQPYKSKKEERKERKRKKISKKNLSNNSGFFAMFAVLKKAISDIQAPFTSIHCGGFAESWVRSFGNLTEQNPHDSPNVIIYNGRKQKHYIHNLADIANVAVLSVDDDRTINRNIQLDFFLVSQEDMVSAWEKKHGAKKNRVILQNSEMLDGIIANGPPVAQFGASILKAIWYDGYGSKLSGTSLLASELYPNYKPTSFLA